MPANSFTAPAQAVAGSHLYLLRDASGAAARAALPPTAPLRDLHRAARKELAPPGTAFEVDLYGLDGKPFLSTGATVSRPLADWGLTPAQSDAETELLVVLRRSAYDVCASAPDGAPQFTVDGALASTKGEAFKASPAWQPRVVQSPKGTACFLAALMVASGRVAGDTERTARVLGHLRALTRFPPAVAAWRKLLTKRLDTLCSAEKAALAAAFYNLAVQTVPGAVSRARVFEHTHVIVAHLLKHASATHAATDGASAWDDVSLVSGAMP